MTCKSSMYAICLGPCGVVAILKPPGSYLALGDIQEPFPTKGFVKVEYGLASKRWFLFCAFCPKSGLMGVMGQ